MRGSCGIVALSVLLALAVGPGAAALAEPADQVAASVEITPPSGGWRSWLRRRVATEEDRRRYGLHMDDNWRQASSTAPVVILLHGLNSTPTATDGLIRPARKTGLPCGVFAYPNDQPLRSSAELLSRQLKAFSTRHPDRSIALVTHSMGGLIARECIEDDALNPGSVIRLIMVSPPTHGSVLARYAVGMDLWEHWLNRRAGGPWRRTRDAITDGLCEAPSDLRPGSKFLSQLNARPRCEGVQYTLLLGTSAQLSEAQHYMIRKTLQVAAKGTPGWESDTKSIERMLSKIDEVIDGRGDGAVAVCRGQLEGVADTHVLPYGHMSVVARDPDEVARQVHSLILKRLLADEGV